MLSFFLANIVFDTLTSLPPTWGWTLFLVFTCYFFIVGLIHIILLVIASINIIGPSREFHTEDVHNLLKSNSLPTISFLVPAFNESKDIAATVRTLLSLSYRYKNIIIINDGSTDATLDILKSVFSLIQIPPPRRAIIPTKAILGYYQSERHPNLIVIDKINGGKADALNAGVNVCTFPLFISTDADTLIDDLALNHLIRPLLINPKTVATSASVGIANGCTIADNRIIKFGFPKKLLVGFQVVEYFRSFMIDREAFNWTRGALVVPGAFGVFKTQNVIDIGGYDPSSMTEDAEIIIQLHQYLLDRKVDYRITYVPGAAAWTEAPENLSTLQKQRLRWYKGTTESLWRHRDMWFNPRYKSIGLAVIPFVLIDKITPVIEVSGYLILLYSWFFGTISVKLLLVISGMFLAFATMISLISMLIGELSFRVYPSLKDALRMIFSCFIYNFTYHFLIVYWNLRGLIVPRKSKKYWHYTKRKGYDKIQG